MDETARAFLLWVPAGTLIPFRLSRITGVDWRSATIEAALLAALGLLIYPTLFALVVVHIVGYPNVEALFLAGFVLAALTVLGYRRSIGSGRPRY